MARSSKPVAPPASAKSRATDGHSERLRRGWARRLPASGSARKLGRAGDAARMSQRVRPSAGPMTGSAIYAAGPGCCPSARKLQRANFQEGRLGEGGFARPGTYESDEWLVRRRGPVPAWLRDATPYVDDPLVDADIPPAQRRALLDLDRNTCRWPVGDPAGSAFFFCGAQPLAGKPYCARHCARAVGRRSET
jgi:hypothetical protein